MALDDLRSLPNCPIWPFWQAPVGLRVHATGGGDTVGRYCIQICLHTLYTHIFLIFSFIYMCTCINCVGLFLIDIDIKLEIHKVSKE